RAQRRFEAREAAKDRAFKAREAAKKRRFQRLQSRRSRREKRRDSKRVNPRNVQRMIAMLENLGRGKAYKASTNKRWAINQLILKDQGFTRKEARRAYRKWRAKHVAGPFKN